MTFDVFASVFRWIEHGWQYHFEVFARCRECHKPSIFVVAQRRHDRVKVEEHVVEKFTKAEHNLMEYGYSLNDMFSVEGFVSLKDHAKTPPPDHLPPDIEGIFREGVACQAIECFNAAGTMYRLCLDMATRALLPAEDDETAEQPSKHERRNLKPRLDWLFAQRLLPEGLKELSDCVREDGNDGAHAGNLTKDDVSDLLDFTVLLLERLYTEPERLRIAGARRAKRRDAGRV